MSDLVRQSFLEDFRLPADRVVTVFCGANVVDPGPRAPTPELEDPVILFVGKDFRRKGGDLLLRAFARVREHSPQARLWMVGGKPSGIESVPEGVEFLGFLDPSTDQGRDTLQNLYRKASVFCLPTRFDPFGTAFVEAMLHGLPCIGPRAWAVPEVIEDGRTGFLVDPDDVEGLSAAILKVLESSDLRTAMGQRGRARALQNFTWPAVANRMLEAMTPLLHGRISR